AGGGMFHHGDGDSPCLSRLPFGVILQDFSFVPSLSRARMPPLPVVCWRLRRFLTAARAAMRRSYNHLRHYESIGNLTPVLIVNSVPLAQSRESGDAPSH